MVEVVVCPTFEKKRRNPLHEALAAKKSDAETPSTLSRKEQVAEELLDTIESVREYTIEGMNRKDRARHRELRMIALGGTKKRNAKMPFKMLMGLRKKGEKRKAAKELEDKQADVVRGYSTYVKPHEKEFVASNGKKDYGENLHLTKGKFKNGVLTVRGLGGGRRGGGRAGSGSRGGRGGRAGSGSRGGRGGRGFGGRGGGGRGGRGGRGDKRQRR